MQPSRKRSNVTDIITTIDRNFSNFSHEPHEQSPKIRVLDKERLAELVRKNYRKKWRGFRRTYSQMQASATVNSIGPV